MSILGVIWFVLVAVLLTGYFALDGFDLGAGVLYPFLAKDERDRAIIRRAIGPVWDGNEVWVLTGGGALFAAFPAAYATSFSGFYLAIMLVLFGLIVRAVALEFRAHDHEWGRVYDAMFVIGSFLPALLCGVAIGNVIGGVQLNLSGDFTGSFFDLLNPFALLCGVLGFVHMLVQGSSWIAVKAPEKAEIGDRARALRGTLVAIEAVVFAAVTVVFFAGVVPASKGAVEVKTLSGIFALLYVACLVGARVCAKKGDLASFLWTEGGCAALLGITASTLFPNLIVAKAASSSITIANAASSDMTLAIMLIIAVIGVPIVLVYHVITYRVFRGRLSKDDLTY